MTRPPRRRLDRRLRDREAAPLATRVTQLGDDVNRTPANNKFGPWAGPPGRAGARRRARRKARRKSKQT